ncbi:cbr-imb-2 related protein [Cyclospora cayetanensis]|uniref:Cbr-imb-2 related protein n=1 Tax=Cyclospora cayetanensis TaxID=88456 RepID=A0A1D3CQX0_9EIME|nr:cbr-imb-2 related protein [Cyclospora cayetanensis]
MDASQLEEDNAGIADEAQDVAPRFHRSREYVGGGGAAAHDEEDEEDGSGARGTWGDGCQESLAPHLHKVLLYLLELTTHPKQLTQRLLDRNKRVQEAACSAFASIEDEARGLLSRFLPDVIPPLQRALQLYQAKNLLILYDAIGTLADGVGPTLCCPLGFALLEALLQQWRQAQAGQPQCLALSESIGCIATAMQAAFAPYAPLTLDRCQDLIAEVIQQIEAQERGEANVWPDRETLECSLDLLSAVADSVGQQLLPLLQQRPQLLLLLERCCRDSSPPVLQSALALPSLGVFACADVCVARWSLCLQRQSVSVQLSPFSLSVCLCAYLAKISCVSLSPLCCVSSAVAFVQLQQHLLHGATSVANNAGWALGEMAVRVAPEAVDPFAESVATELTRILQRQELHRALLQNVAITLGRLALVAPHRISPLLPQLLPRWCAVMRAARNDRDKANAFQGICTLIERTPGAAAGEGLLELVVCILAFEQPPPELEQQFARVMHER